MTFQSVVQVNTSSTNHLSTNESRTGNYSEPKTNSSSTINVSNSESSIDHLSKALSENLQNSSDSKESNSLENSLFEGMKSQEKCDSEYDNSIPLSKEGKAFKNMYSEEDDKKYKVII